MSVRAARVELALALLGDHERLGQAIAELGQALNEPGDEPPDWVIHLHLGRLAAGSTGDHADALTELVAAVLGAPEGKRKEPANLALALLGDPEAHELASRLDARAVRSLLTLAEQPSAGPESVRLAARISFLRGDADRAWSLISSNADPAVDADPALRIAHEVAQAIRLIGESRFADALALLDEQPAADPSAASARALALYGLGQLDEATLALAGTSPTFDIAATRAIISLRKAARTTGDERPAAIAEADRAASEAARLEPSPGEGLLLRAEVALEGTLDIDSGRKMLTTAIRRLRGNPDTSRLWRLQRTVRDDDVFRYMTLEVAAARGDDRELLAISASDLPFSTTTHRQDAEIAGLVAKALREAGRPLDAADLFAVASTYYDNATEPDLALEALQAVEEVRPSTEGSLQLAERYWQASFRAADRDRDEALHAVQKGIDALDGLDGRSSDLERGQRMQGTYLRGLLLERSVDASRAATRRDRWLALPWLLLAAMENPAQSYRAAHVAWALDEAKLRRAALHFADRALSTVPDDLWLRETATVMRFNWYGLLDANIEGLIEGLDQSWGDSIRAFDAIMRDDLLALRERVAGITFDAIWARSMRATAVTRLEGYTASAPLYRALFEEARRDPADHGAASDAALVLREIDEARAHIDAGLAEGTISAAAGRLTSLAIDLLEGDRAAGEGLLDYVRGMSRPFSLRELAHAIVPVLTEAWSDAGRAVTVLGEVRQAAIAQVDELERSSLPTLTVELDELGEGSSDPAIDRLLRELLRLEDIRQHDPAGATEGLQLLATENADEPIGPALARTASGG